MEVATLGGGCFWCLEAVYLDLIGVQEVRSGYAGGQLPIPPMRKSVEVPRVMPRWCNFGSTRRSSLFGRSWRSSSLYMILRPSTGRGPMSAPNTGPSSLPHSGPS